MREFVPMVAALVLCLSGCSTDDGPVPADASLTATAPKTSVEDDYAALRDALRGGDGDAAASLVTASTLAEYETCRKLALDSSGTDFADLNQVFVLLVFQLRYLLEHERLSEMTGRDVFAWGVAEGMVKKEMLDAIDIHKVQRDGMTAYATMTQNGKIATDALFTFRNEDGRWKLDMMELARIGGKRLDAVREQAGRSKVEMAVYLLESTYGKSIPPTILNGPLK